MVTDAAKAVLAIALVLLGASAAGQTVIDDFSSLSPWSVAPGPGCGGADGGTLISGFGPGGVGDGGVSKSAVLSYDFDGVKRTPNYYTGCSMVMTRSVSTIPASAIGLWVLSPPDAMLNLEVQDTTGQWLTYHVSRPLDALDDTQWYQQVVELDAPTAWTGDGGYAGSIMGVGIAALNRANYLTAGTLSVSDLVAFNSIGGDLDPFGATLSPAPAGNADLTAGFTVNIFQNMGVIPPSAAVGFRYARSDVRWNETEKDAGVYDFGLQDQIQHQLNSSGMKALWLLGGGNPIYGDCGPSATYPNGCAPSATSLRHFQAWAAALATHFKGDADRYEIWNEPNGKQFEFANYNGTAYAPVLNAGIAGVHQGDPNAVVTAGGLASLGQGDSLWPGTFDWAFLQGYLEADGGVGANAVAFHPYRAQGGETTTDDLVLARAILGKYFSPLPEVWNTEWGYNVDEEEDAGATLSRAEAWQALYDVRMLLATRAIGFGLSNCFSADFPGFTILQQDGGSTPASIAIGVLSSQVAGRTYAGFIPATPTSFHALRFDGSTDSVVVLWSDVPGGTVNITLPAPVTSAVDMMGNPLSLSTVGTRVPLTITESGGPVYVTLPPPGIVDGGTTMDAGVSIADAGAADAGQADGGQANGGQADAGTGADGAFSRDSGSGASSHSGCGCGFTDDWPVTSGLWVFVGWVARVRRKRQSSCV
jgi:hypothetical protein